MFWRTTWADRNLSTISQAGLVNNLNDGMAWGLFPLFFVFIFLSSSSLPRNLLTKGWFHTVATWNPISYLIEGFRSLYIIGWDATALIRGFAVAGGLLAIGLALVAVAMRGRLQRT